MNMFFGSKTKRWPSGGWGRVKVRSFYCVPISETHDQRFSIVDVQNVIDRSKYRCSHAYCVIKLELLQFASNLLHLA